MMRSNELAARVRAIEERIASLDGSRAPADLEAQQAPAEPSAKRARLSCLLHACQRCFGKRRI